MIGLSRVYQGAHYPSDILASYALGTILLILMVRGQRVIGGDARS